MAGDSFVFYDPRQNYYVGTSSQQAQGMGLGPFEQSGNNYSSSGYLEYQARLAEAQSRAQYQAAQMQGAKRPENRAPSLDDGLLVYLRARSKAWLEGVKVK